MIIFPVFVDFFTQNLGLSVISSSKRYVYYGYLDGKSGQA